MSFKLLVVHIFHGLRDTLSTEGKGNMGGLMPYSSKVRHLGALNTWTWRSLRKLQKQEDTSDTSFPTPTPSLLPWSHRTVLWEVLFPYPEERVNLISKMKECLGWHHRLDGRKFEQTLGAGEGHGSLMCCSPWGQRVRDDLATEPWATASNPLSYSLSPWLSTPCQTSRENVQV